MAIHDAETEKPSTRNKRSTPPTVKQMSELAKLVSSIDASHFNQIGAEPFDTHRQPDIEVRDPVVEAIPNAPVNLAPPFNPEPVSTLSILSSQQGTTEMNTNQNTQTALNNTTATAIAAATASGSDQALAAAGATPAPAVIPAALGTTAGVMDVPAPAGSSTTNNTAASAGAIAGSMAAPAAGTPGVNVATPNMGKISRRVGLGLDTLMFKPDSEENLLNNLNLLVRNAVEVRDEVGIIADRLAALEARRSTNITMATPDWKEEVPKQIAIGAGIGLVTYAGIVLISKGVEMLMSDGGATATE